LTNDALPPGDPVADPKSAADGGQPVARAGEAPRPRGTLLIWLLGIIAVLGLGAASYALMQLSQVRKEASRRLTDLEQTTVRTSEIAARADAEARAARERAALLEARVAEEQSQRESLEQLYADLSRGRDEAVLVEVERLVAMAGQELAISGNVGTALAALQTADARLARVENARFVPLRRVIARDVEKLKAAPTVDITGIALKLDQLAAGAESWPLLSDPRPQPSAAATSPASDPMAPSPGLPWWERWVERLRMELGDYRDLVRLRQVETPDALLLAPQQQQLVRLQIKLRILNARQAVLARNDRLYRADLMDAQALITRYVDVRQPAAAAAAGLIKQLSATPLSVDVPQINDSIAAVRAARTAPGR
jgi:uroporphyrin-III C-methyltransferase